MPPFIASIVAVTVVACAFILDRRRNPEATLAIWIPLVWLTLISTRYVSQWLGGSIVYENPDAFLEGSPLDQVVFLGLYAAAILVLLNRRATLKTFVITNPMVALFFGYCLVSVCWSDYPWTAFKRWVKVTEHIAMVMVLLTEPNRTQAVDALFRRFTYFTVTISVLFIKYYPEFGRHFDYWTGVPYNTGITADKNALGHICVIGGAFLASSLFSKEQRLKGRIGRIGLLLDCVMIGSTIWLLGIANAKTALVCFLLAIAIVAVLARTPLGRRPRLVVAVMVLGLLAAALLDFAFDIKESGIRALNRNPTLTDRTTVWADVLAVPNNPLVGTGFESFWLGPRVETLWKKYWWRPNQAHNGWIETYINLGAVGLVLLSGVIVSGFLRILKTLPTDRGFGRLRLAFLISILLFNYTDATFKALHALYFLFFLIVSDYPRTLCPSAPRARLRSQSSTRQLPAA